MDCTSAGRGGKDLYPAYDEMNVESWEIVQEFNNMHPKLREIYSKEQRSIKLPPEDQPIRVDPNYRVFKQNIKKFDYLRKKYEKKRKAEKPLQGAYRPKRSRRGGDVSPTGSDMEAWPDNSPTPSELGQQGDAIVKVEQAFDGGELR